MELMAGGKKAKPDYKGLYTKALLHTVEQLKKEPEDKQVKLRAVFYGVKYVNATHKGHLSAEEAANLFALVSAISSYMEELTPRELMQMFPVQKVYDGDRWEIKDYFFTMDVLRQHGLDKPLGKDVQEILFDYTNMNINRFMVATMSAMSAISRYNGGRGFMEEFAAYQGIELQTYTMSKDKQGRSWLTDTATGKRQRVKVKRPKYLRAI